MSNKSYGCQKERDARHKLLAEGANYVLRMRGSLGKYDLMAMYDGYSLWISVKAGSDKYLENCKKKFFFEEEHNLPPYHHAQLWLWKKGKNAWEVLSYRDDK